MHNEVLDKLQTLIFEEKCIILPRNKIVKLIKFLLKIQATENIIIEGLPKLYIRIEVAIARMLTTNEAKVPIQICNPMEY
jgi:hypothetical protein